MGLVPNEEGIKKEGPGCNAAAAPKSSYHSLLFQASSFMSACLSFVCISGLPRKTQCCFSFHRQAINLSIEPFPSGRGEKTSGTLSSLPWLLEIFCKATAKQRRLAASGEIGRGLAC
jgi:hypothetical protein